MNRLLELTCRGAVVLGAALTWTACGGESAAGSGGTLPSVAFVTNGVDPFWTIAEAGALQAGRDLAVGVVVKMPHDNEVSTQRQILEDMVTRGMQGIAVSPIEHENQTPFLDQLAAKTVLITQDSDAPASKRVCFVGMDNYDAGRMTGRLVADALPDGGSVMIFVGRLGQDNAEHRRQGVIDELLDRPRDPSRRDPPDVMLRGDRYTVLGTLTDGFDKTVAKNNAEDALTKHADLGCMVGLFAYNPPACIEALRQVGKLGKVAVVGFDEAEATLQGIVDGHVFGTVVQDPYQYGYQSVRVLKELIAGDRASVPADAKIYIPARAITASNVEAFWQDLRQKLGK